MPKGIGTPTFVTFTLTANSVAHHALGAVGAAWNSAYLKIVVFPSHTLAVADMRAAPNWSFSPNPAPAPYLQPSHVYTDPAQGAAYFVFTLGDALVEAGSDTQVGSPPGQGPPLAQKLAKVALSYVESVTSAATS